MNPKDTQEYVMLRGAAIAFLEAEKKFFDATGYKMTKRDIFELETRLDAARSVLWDVINDKDMKGEHTLKSGI